MDSSGGIVQAGGKLRGRELPLGAAGVSLRAEFGPFDVLRHWEPDAMGVAFRRLAPDEVGLWPVVYGRLAGAPKQFGKAAFSGLSKGNATTCNCEKGKPAGSGLRDGE